MNGTVSKASPRLIWASRSLEPVLMAVLVIFALTLSPWLRSVPAILNAGLAWRFSRVLSAPPKLHSNAVRRLRWLCLGAATTPFLAILPGWQPQSRLASLASPALAFSLLCALWMALCLVLKPPLQADPGS
ncbi:MAG: hypothetical protein DWQ01_03130 [Planctomycetota bacterium]|nr:MAG: hypothetical protein DWQ01_03130 [Planctomycetota bacterium]